MRPGSGRAENLAETCHIPRVVTDLADLCRMDQVEVIDVCTPSFLHYPHTLQALAAGKHVVCEKPVAGSLQEVDQLIAAETESGQQVMPIFQYRYGHGIQKLKFLVDQGVAGRAYLTTVETAWRRRPPLCCLLAWQMGHRTRWSAGHPGYSRPRSGQLHPGAGQECFCPHQNPGQSY